MLEKFESLPNDVALLSKDVKTLQKLIQELINSHVDQAEILGVDDVSILTGYSKSTIYQYVNKDIIPFHKPVHGGRKLIFYRSEIESWLRGKKLETSAEFSERKESEFINYYKWS